LIFFFFFFFFSSRRRHTRSDRDWSSDVCSSDLDRQLGRVIAALAELGMADVAPGVDQVLGGPVLVAVGVPGGVVVVLRDRIVQQIGRASCRERVEVWGVEGTCKEKRRGEDRRGA